MARVKIDYEAQQDELLTDAESDLQRGSGTDGEESGSNIDSASEDDPDSSDSAPEDEDASQYKLSNVSFGALAKAQESLGNGERKRKRGEEASSEHKSKLASMRERLQELRERTEGRQGNSGHDSSRVKNKDELFGRSASKTDKNEFFSNGNDDEEDESDDDDSESDGSEDGNTRGHKRSSKHAPTAMPANRAVGRYREVVDVPKIKSRDPRFDVTSGHLDRNTIQSRYSFLNDYQIDELTSLKKALKDPRAKLSQDQREKLQRKAVSLESKIAANKAKAREEKVRREHRTKEREAVAQGKKPFYLKKSDVKKQALVDRFEGMKSRQKEKVIQRRRKKLAAKERKDMPMERRM